MGSTNTTLSFNSFLISSVNEMQIYFRLPKESCIRLRTSYCTPSGCLLILQKVTIQLVVSEDILWATQTNRALCSASSFL